MIVVGAGIYGSLIALKLAEVGYDVKIYERSMVLGGSTKYNMWRVHNGYQYPNKKCMDRSSETYDDFNKMFASCITDVKTVYMIASDSNISASDYVDFMNSKNLPYEQADDATIQLLKNYQYHNEKPAVYIVNESVYDPVKLQKYVSELLEKQDMITLIKEEYVVPDVPKDIVINTVPTTEKGCYEIVYGYLPEKYRDLCIVVMDGPFMTINRYADTNMHAIYHVVHSRADVSDSLNKDIAPSEHSHYEKMVEECKKYFTDFDFEYIGSTFTQKLTNPACPNCRHAYIKRDGDVFNCYPGKVGEALYVSEQIVKKIEHHVNNY